MVSRTLPLLLESSRRLRVQNSLTRRGDMGLDWKRPRIVQVPILLEELGDSYGKARFIDILKPVVSEMQTRLEQPVTEIQEQEQRGRRQSAKRLRRLARYEGDPEKYLGGLSPNFVGNTAIQREVLTMHCGMLNVPHEQLQHANLLASVQHLVDPESRLSFSDPKEAAEVDTWLAWERLHLGKMQDKAIKFYRESSVGNARWNPVEKTEYLYGKLDTALTNRKYLVGAGAGRYSIADIASFCWVNMAHYSGIKLERFSNVWRWWANIEARPAIQHTIKRHKKLQFQPKYNTRFLDLIHESGGIKRREEALAEAYRKRLNANASAPCPENSRYVRK